MKIKSNHLSKILIVSILLAGIALLGSPANTHSEESSSADVIINGLNTTALSGVVDTLKKNPEGGRVTFYSTSVWQNGMRAFTTIGGYKIDDPSQMPG